MSSHTTSFREYAIMKRTAAFFALVAAALFSLAALADTLTYVGTTTAPTVVTQGLQVRGATAIAITVSDFRDGGAADIGGLKSVDAKAWKWTNTPAAAGQTYPINGAGSYVRAPEYDFRFTDDNDAGTGLAVNPSPRGYAASIATRPLYGNIFYTTVFNDIDGGTDSHIVTIESH